MKLHPLVAAVILSASVVQAQAPKEPPPSLFPAGYHDHEALTAALRRVAAEHPDRVRVRSLARSLQGRDVWLVTLGPAASAANPRPAILIVANLEADHVVGSQVALRLIEKLAGDAKYDGPTVYIVPRLNPDGAERVLRRPSADFRTNLRAMDRDRDGRSNEDGPEDLDGDGLVTIMRVKDSKATLVPDGKDARLLRKADPVKEERAVYSELSEGVDNDGDGRINEDPPGGVNLNRNWPHGWTEFDPEAGYSPASEPEVHALIQFAFDHPEIAVVWGFGLRDNLASAPRKPGSTLDDADLPYLAEFSRLFGKATNQKEPDAPKDEPSEPRREAPARKDQPARKDAPRGGRAVRQAPAARAEAPRPSGEASSSDGALVEWAYHQYGAVPLASRLWAQPELPAGEAGKPAAPADGDARWLFWNDQVMGGKAFVPFHAFEHPTLGKVEIGGWRPGVRLNPPAEQLGAIADSHLAFFKAMAAKLPRLEVAEVKVEPKGGGLFTVSAVVENAGYLPTSLAQGVRIRKTLPVLVRLNHEGARILAGRALERIDTLAGSGGRREFRWLLFAPETVKKVTLEASCPKAGRAAKTIELKHEERAEEKKP